MEDSSPWSARGASSPAPVRNGRARIPIVFPEDPLRREKVISRFWSKVDKDCQVSRPCWPWTEGLDKPGYGRFKLGREKVFAHRVAYVLTYGPVPDELEIDHLCGNPWCCRPDHLEAVPQPVNHQRSYCTSAVNARRDSCSNGHPFTAENTYLRKNGNRACRACKRERDRREWEYRAKEKARGRSR